MRKQVERIVDAICAGDTDPALREHAVMIAKIQLSLFRLQAQKIAVTERQNPKASHEPK